jgi:twitching motility two-component system response regulator PilG
MLLARALEQGPLRLSADAPTAAAAPAPAVDEATVDPGDTVEASPPTIPAPPSLQPVLVVDDSLAVRAHLRSLLEARGIAVTLVESAEAGIEAAASTRYGCILMDVLMPGIDGYEACRRIKAASRAARQRTPIVMLTSKSSPFDRIRGKMAGCDAYLAKPVDATVLHQVLAPFIAPLAVAPATTSPGRAAPRDARGTHSSLLAGKTA